MKTDYEDYDYKEDNFMRHGNNRKTRHTRNSKEKHLRDTNNYRGVAHISVNDVCTSFLMAKRKSCDTGELTVDWLEMNYEEQVFGICLPLATDRRYCIIKTLLHTCQQTLIYSFKVLYNV